MINSGLPPKLIQSKRMLAYLVDGLDGLRILDVTDPAKMKDIGFYDTPVIVGSTIIYAYLLALTVFLLDFIYAIVDPRVKIGGGSNQ